jgi:hypothetical protein
LISAHVATLLDSVIISVIHSRTERVSSASGA